MQGRTRVYVLSLRADPWVSPTFNIRFKTRELLTAPFVPFSKGGRAAATNGVLGELVSKRPRNDNLEGVFPDYTMPPNFLGVFQSI